MEELQSSGPDLSPAGLSAFPENADFPTLRVYEALRNQILNYSIPPSTRIIIQQIAKEFGVSSTPVREACRLLQGDNLLVATSNRGYATTGTLNRREVEQLYEFRLLIEPWAARVASAETVRNPGAELLRELHRCAKGPLEDTRTLISHDNIFHSIIIAATGNHALTTAYEQSRCHLHLFRSSPSRIDWPATFVEHEEIARAIQSRNQSASETAMLKHLIESSRRMSENWAIDF